MPHLSNFICSRCVLPCTIFFIVFFVYILIIKYCCVCLICSDNNLWRLKSPSQRDYHAASNSAITLPSRYNGTRVRAWKVALCNHAWEDIWAIKKRFHCISLCMILFITKRMKILFAKEATPFSTKKNILSAWDLEVAAYT